MIESLKDLDKQLKKLKTKLHIFFGNNIKILNEIDSIHKINCIYSNKDFTKYAKNRDK